MSTLSHHAAFIAGTAFGSAGGAFLAWFAQRKTVACVTLKKTAIADTFDVTVSVDKAVFRDRPFKIKGGGTGNGYGATVEIDLEPKPAKQAK